MTARCEALLFEAPNNPRDLVENRLDGALNARIHSDISRYLALVNIITCDTPKVSGAKSHMRSG